jgi:hypothetical protein
VSVVRGVLEDEVDGVSSGTGDDLE